MTTATIERQTESLNRATSGRSFANYPAIFDGFAAKGIPEEDIVPRVNVLTYHAWRAVGRQVRKGESGVKISTFVPMSRNDPDTGERKEFKRPKRTTVFHISQTDPAE